MQWQRRVERQVWRYREDESAPKFSVNSRPWESYRRMDLDYELFKDVRSKQVEGLLKGRLPFGQGTSARVFKP